VVYERLHSMRLPDALLGFGTMSVTSCCDGSRGFGALPPVVQASSAASARAGRPRRRRLRAWRRWAAQRPGEAHGQLLADARAARGPASHQGCETTARTMVARNGWGCSLRGSAGCA